MSDENKKVETPAPAEAPKNNDMPPQAPGLEKKINIIAIVAVIAILGIVFYVISKNSCADSSCGPTSPAVVSMSSSDADGPVVPAPPQVTVPGKANVPAKPKAPPADLWAFLPDTVAEVDGKAIPKKEIVDMFNSQFPDGRPPAQVNAEMLKNVAPDLVRSFVERRLLLDMAEKAGFKPSQEMAVKRLNEKVKKLEAQQLEMMKSGLAAQNMTLEAYVAKMAEGRQMQDEMAIDSYLYDFMEKNIKVTDAELKAAYEKYKQQLFVKPGDAPGSLRASHILFKVDDVKNEKAKKEALTKAQKTLVELRAKPEDFGRLASSLSDCPSKSNQGSLGNFNKGDMVKEFEEAAYALKVGDISEPVETQFGYHIIRRDAPFTGSETSFEDAKKQLEEITKAEKMGEVVKGRIEKAFTEHNVKILVSAPEVPKAPEVPAVTAPAAKVETPAAPAPAAK